MQLARQDHAATRAKHGLLRHLVGDACKVFWAGAIIKAPVQRSGLQKFSPICRRSAGKGRAPVGVGALQQVLVAAALQLRTVSLMGSPLLRRPRRAGLQ
jgi:hypothetical protein